MKAEKEEPNCHFLSGFLEMSVERLLGLSDLYCQEMKCAAKGDDCCEFVIAL